MRCIILILFFLTFFSANCQTKKDTLALLLKQAHIPGIQLSYFNEKDDYSVAIGVASKSKIDTVTHSTIFQAASLSKPITAYIALKLADKGVLNINKPLQSYLPYNRLDSTEFGNLITAKHILSHTSGLPNWGSKFLTMHFKPGLGWRYSGEGYVYLAKVLENITKTPFEKLAQELVFSPLKMNSTSFVWKSEFENLIADGHSELEQPFTSWKPNKPNAAASLLTNAKDYATFLKAVLNGTGLSKQSHQLMLTPFGSAQTPETSFATAPYITWGLGVGLEHQQNTTNFWHWGDNGTFKAFMYVMPKTQEGLVYFCNSENGLSITKEVLSLFFKNKDLKAVNWIDYTHFSDSLHQAKIKLQKAYLNEPADKAQTVLKELLKNTETKHNFKNIVEQTALLLITNKEPEKAISFIKNARNYYKNNYKLKLYLADAFAVKKQYQKALNHYITLKKDTTVNNNLLASREYWVLQALNAKKNENKKLLPLKKYAGSYGDAFSGVLSNNKLFLKNNNSSIAIELIPLSRAVFDTASPEQYRIVFKLNKRTVTALVLSSINGDAKQFLKLN